MKFTTVFTFLASALAVAASALPATADPLELGYAASRADLPAGVEIIDLTTADADLIEGGLGRRDTTLARRSDCNGSGLCGSGTSGGACIAALSGYNDGSWYCGYTSRVSGHCTAIFQCSNFNGNCFAGWWVKEQFHKIYNQVNCGICGTYTIPDGSGTGCRATFNYCGTCNNVGRVAN